MELEEFSELVVELFGGVTMGWSKSLPKLRLAVVEFCQVCAWVPKVSGWFRKPLTDMRV